MTDHFNQLHPYIVIPMEDDLLHIAANGYKCGDPTCLCANDSNETDMPTVIEGSLSYIVDETNQLN